MPENAQAKQLPQCMRSGGEQIEIEVGLGSYAPQVFPRYVNKIKKWVNLGRNSNISGSMCTQCGLLTLSATHPERVLTPSPMEWRPS